MCSYCRVLNVQLNYIKEKLANKTIKMLRNFINDFISSFF
jgi:hypothetical protein